MFALSYICGCCRRTIVVGDSIRTTQPPTLICPQCHTTIEYSRLRGQKRAGWHRPGSRIEVVVFPHRINDMPNLGGEEGQP